MMRPNRTETKPETVVTDEVNTDVRVDLPDWRSRILVIAPHADDETIGLGGLISRYADRVAVRVVAVGNYNNRDGRRIYQHERMKELGDAMDVLGVEDYAVLIDDNNAESRLDLRVSEIVKAVDFALKDLTPTAVLWAAPSHHQDHRAVDRAVIASLRNYTPFGSGILLAARYTYAFHAAPHCPGPPQGAPRFLFGISEEEMRRKADALVQYRSQFPNGMGDDLLGFYMRYCADMGFNLNPGAEVLWPAFGELF